MVIDISGFTKGIIGKRLPADSTLKNMSKAELIKLFHVAEWNYNTLLNLYNGKKDTPFMDNDAPVVSHDCNQCIHSDICENKEIVQRRGLACYIYEKQPPFTFNDKINLMTPEEKAEWIFHHDEKTEQSGRWTKEQILGYLLSEYKEK